jgi:hypothetical protein
MRRGRFVVVPGVDAAGRPVLLLATAGTRPSRGRERRAGRDGGPVCRIGVTPDGRPSQVSGSSAERCPEVRLEYPVGRLGRRHGATAQGVRYWEDRVMLIESIQVRDFRSIADSGDLPLGPITVLIGRNNTGKSTLLRAMYLMQVTAPYDSNDVRLRAQAAVVTVRIGNPVPRQIAGDVVMRDAKLTVSLSRAARNRGAGLELALTAVRQNPASRENENVTSSIEPLPATRPDHLFAPIFSRRKSYGYNQQARGDLAYSVEPNDNNLTSRIFVLSGHHPEAKRYRELSNRVLGTEVSVHLIEQGQQPGTSVSSTENISLERMGDGIGSALALIAELATPGPRVILVEEPENDMYPGALRELLAAMIEATPQVQFVVSTHSDLVLRSLGSVDGAKVYRTEYALENGLPTSRYIAVEDTWNRLEALRDLGYEEELPLGWLIFEESTAERVVKSVLIPAFAPRLAALRTVSANGAGNVARTAQDLHRVLLFAHLADKVSHRAWVIVDGDEAGQDVILALRRAFTSWPDEHFHALSESDFERYYPERFRPKVEKIEANTDWQIDREEKGALALEVCNWFIQDPETAKEALEVSCGPVIDVLRKIEDQLAGMPLKY